MNQTNSQSNDLLNEYNLSSNQAPQTNLQNNPKQINGQQNSSPQVCATAQNVNLLDDDFGFVQQPNLPQGQIPQSNLNSQQQQYQIPQQQQQQQLPTAQNQQVNLFDDMDLVGIQPQNNILTNNQAKMIPQQSSQDAIELIKQEFHNFTITCQQNQQFEMKNEEVSLKNIVQNNSNLYLLQKNFQEYIKTLPEQAPDDYEPKKVPIYKLYYEECEYSKLNKEQIFQQVAKFHYIDAKDDTRPPNSSSDGGKKCVNEMVVKRIRSVGKTIIKEIGKKILSGDFNLTQISFPIKAMIPQSSLVKALASTCLFPYYVNRAASISDKVERMKLVICATLGNFYINCSFFKPLNPILGETAEGCYLDGTQMYVEQISHHPPITYFYVIGPNKSYKFYGNYNYESHAGLNSLSLLNLGNRNIHFSDGQKIIYNFASEEYSGSFLGTMKIESKGKMSFVDAQNQICAIINIGKVKKRPSDYFQGEITVQNQPVSQIQGTYLGYIEFDGVRYWDYRYVTPFKPTILQSVLPSDQSFRKDKNLLQRGHIELAQKAKEELEQMQRSDKALRTKYNKENKLQ